MTKQIVTEPGTNYQCLQLCWASKSNCEQRAGRTGRVMDGKVYRMVPRAFYEKVLQAESVPKMLRAPLTNIILKTKVLDMGEPKALLALSLDPPNLSNIKQNILLLKEVGALRRGMQEFDGHLTSLGHVMASLPLDVHVTKLIVLGYVFEVLSDAIILAASMTVKDMFEIKFFNLESTYHEKLYWAANSQSDPIACLNARHYKVSHYISSPNEERDWARRNSLRVRSLREMDVFICEITEKLRTFGIIETMGSEKNTWESLSNERIFLLKLIIAEKTLGGRDPTTVVLHGWPLRHPGSLYSKRFQEIFGQHMELKNPENITVSFDESNRVYIQHEPKIRAPDDYTFVRDCVKMRHCRNQIKVKLLSETDARHRAEELGLTKAYKKFMSESSNPEKPSSSSCRRDMPFSPVEVRLTHIVKNEMGKMISVEFTSVNSVLLDLCPASPKELFLVAQNISRDSKNMLHLILRNTTLLPTTPGLASLVILIFTPCMELRRSPMGIYYTGVLCGLGYNYNSTTNESLFPEHDLETLFDVEFTMDDLRKINQLRHWMNIAMLFNDKSEIVDDEAHHDRDVTVNCQNQIKHALNDLLYKNRKKIEPILVSNFNKWSRYDETLFLVPARETLRTNNVYGLHKALELNEKNDTLDRLEEIISNSLELEALAYQNSLEATTAPVYCKLCLTEINDIVNLRAHLWSEQHVAKQRLIDTTDEFGGNLQKLMELRL
ncbi:putative ATP-dependent RNA helicase spindle-E, partial [Temnothorax longispinosus]